MDRGQRKKKSFILTFGLKSSIQGAFSISGSLQLVPLVSTVTFSMYR